MACNRADYLERTINSVLKYVSLQPIFFTPFNTFLCNNLFLFFRYQRPISSRFPLFVSQVFFYLYTSRWAVLRNLWSLIQMISKCKYKYNTHSWL